MNYDVICFTEKGSETANRINEARRLLGEENLNVYAKFEKASSDFVLVSEDISSWAEKRFNDKRGMIFIGACGIAVRAISAFVKDKLNDPPVIVIDDNATYVIPILSGHVGNANKDALFLSGLIGAVPVITTSTDVNDAFSADLFAMENDLRIVNRDGIKKVSGKAIDGKPITISVKDYPPVEDVDVLVTDDEKNSGFSLLLSPKRYVIGVGMKKDTAFADFEELVFNTLSKNDIDINDIAAIGTIDIKENEPALQEFSRKYRMPVISFTADMLNKAKGDFDHSDFVEKTVGTDNVCERAAVAASDYKGKIIVKKTAGNGMTIAVAKRGKGSV